MKEQISTLLKKAFGAAPTEAFDVDFYLGRLEAKNNKHGDGDGNSDRLRS